MSYLSAGSLKPKRFFGPWGRLRWWPSPWPCSPCSQRYNLSPIRFIPSFLPHSGLDVLTLSPICDRAFWCSVLYSWSACSLGFTVWSKTSGGNCRRTFICIIDTTVWKGGFDGPGSRNTINWSSLPGGRLVSNGWRQGWQTYSPKAKSGPPEGPEQNLKITKVTLQFVNCYSCSTVLGTLRTRESVCLPGWTSNLVTGH